MQTLGVVEDTLFVPMMGRIYASEHCPQILYDRKTLELKNRLPSDLIKQNMHNQYALLASASRSANMDWFIRSFLERRPDGVRGMTMMKKKYMKQVGHADAQMFFYVDSAEELAAKVGGNVKVIAEEPYYRYIPKNGLKLSTKVSMTVSDQFKMVKMIHLKL